MIYGTLVRLRLQKDWDIRVMRLEAPSEESLFFSSQPRRTTRRSDKNRDNPVVLTLSTLLATAAASDCERLARPGRVGAD